MLCFSTIRGSAKRKGNPSRRVVYFASGLARARVSHIVNSIVTVAVTAYPRSPIPLMITFLFVLLEGGLIISNITPSIASALSLWFSLSPPIVACPANIIAHCLIINIIWPSDCRNKQSTSKVNLRTSMTKAEQEKENKAEKKADFFPYWDDV